MQHFCRFVARCASAFVFVVAQPALVDAICIRFWFDAAERTKCEWRTSGMCGVVRFDPPALSHFQHAPLPINPVIIYFSDATADAFACNCKQRKMMNVDFMIALCAAQAEAKKPSIKIPYRNEVD